MRHLLMPLCVAATSAAFPEPCLVFCCGRDNDLYVAASAAGLACPRYALFGEAIERAPDGAGLLILADAYPEKTTGLSQAGFDFAARKGLRVYIEYPSTLPGAETGPARETKWERAVVSSGFFGEDLPTLTILAIHGCHFIPAKADDASLTIARVAGYDSAVYGLPEERHPLLFELPGKDVLAATTKLSHFITGRYGPRHAWRAIAQRILQWAAPGLDVSGLDWTPSVRASYGKEEALPEGVEQLAFKRAVDWFDSSRLLIHESWLPRLTPLFAKDVGDGPMLPRTLPNGDGSLGILEGYSAHVTQDGGQLQRYVVRNDCMGESAMALAFGREADTARNLCDFICFDSLVHQGIRADPAHPCFGLMSWGITSMTWERAFYGDDNARSILGLVACAALLESDRWDESVLKALLANLRTTGTRGFRGSRIDIPDLEKNGWRHYHDRDIVNPAPHYESYLWACFLWAYRATGHAPFLAKPKAAIRTTMEAYPDGWKWTNGIAQERARMLLCLSWLVRLEDTPEHRGWLSRIAKDLLKNQQPCGAIREELGDPAKGDYGAVPSNEAYGTTETPLIQENGDPACDLLYTTNFAFLALHEAAAATGDERIRKAEDRLAEFLCRIQVRSDAHPELDGAWFRAFDFDKWEHWGSSADAGWGAWSIESGWTVGWITAVLGLRLMDTSFWELTAGSRIGERLDAVQALMAQGDGAPLAVP